MVCIVNLRTPINLPRHPTVPWFIPISALPLRILLTEYMASACSKSLSLLASSVMLTQGSGASGGTVSPNNIIQLRAEI